MSSKEKDPFKKLSKKDHERQENQLLELAEKGYFTLEDGSKNTDEVQSPLTKRGRKPKSGKDRCDDDISVESSPPPPKKRRGRPPKSDKSMCDDEISISATVKKEKQPAVLKKRGRPRKIESQHKPTAPLLDSKEIDMIVSDFKNALDKNEVPDDLTVTEWMSSPLANRESNSALKLSKRLSANSKISSQKIPGTKMITNTSVTDNDKANQVALFKMIIDDFVHDERKKSGDDEMLDGAGCCSDSSDDDKPFVTKKQKVEEIV